MTALAHAPTGFAPMLRALDAVRDRRGPAAVHGLAPGLLVTDPVDWTAATRYADGSALPDLLAAAHRRWPAAPATTAALAWKSYAYWLILPAALGYAAARRVPLLSPANTLVRLPGSAPFLQVGVRAATIAVGPDDPLAGRPDALVVDDLPGFVRQTLLDGHLAPVLDRIRERVRIGRRTLLGSVASAVGYALARSGNAVPEPRTAAYTLLRALAVQDLVEVTPDLRVQRRTCCLAFTLPEPKICDGCCLRAAG